MREASAVIRLDGSHGEGGGALLRTALVMSALTQQGLKIDNIRGNTKFFGLDPEDIAILRTLATCCGADVIGGDLGSTSLTFLPGSLPRSFNGDVQFDRTDQGRGPNAPIVLASLIPLLAKTQAYSSVTCKGETYGHHALSFDYFSNVTIEAMKRMGLYANAELLRPGFGRESEGEVGVDIEPSHVTGLNWTERGRLKTVRAIVATSGLANAMGDRAISHLRNMASNANLPMEPEHVTVGSRQPGSYITVWAEYENGMGGGTAMGSRGLKAETLAHAAFDQMTVWMSTPGCVDEFLADQLLLPLVVGTTASSITVPRLTERLTTAIWVVKQFTPIHLTVKNQENGCSCITIDR
jgi:RNA 3'-terminal phosphate cyclase (ATP)